MWIQRLGFHEHQKETEVHRSWNSFLESVKDTISINLIQLTFLEPLLLVHRNQINGGSGGSVYQGVRPNTSPWPRGKNRARKSGGLAARPSAATVLLSDLEQLASFLLVGLDFLILKIRKLDQMVSKQSHVRVQTWDSEASDNPWNAAQSPKPSPPRSSVLPPLTTASGGESCLEEPASVRSSPVIPRAALS